MEDKFDDHYFILGLPSGEEGAKLSEKEITKAYRKRALDKRPDHHRSDIHASYAILKDEKARKSFDDLLRVRHDKLRRQWQQDSERRKMVNDLEQRERDSESKARRQEEEEERFLRKEEVARIRATQADRVGSRLDKEEKVLKIGGEDYSAAERLRELFGEVEDDVVMKRQRGSAVVSGKKIENNSSNGSIYPRHIIKINLRQLKNARKERDREEKLVNDHKEERFPVHQVPKAIAKCPPPKESTEISKICGKEKLKEQKFMHLDEEALELKMEASKRKLQQGYKQFESAKKKIRMIDLKDLPQQGSFGCRNNNHSKSWNRIGNLGRVA